MRSWEQGSHLSWHRTATTCAQMAWGQSHRAPGAGRAPCLGQPRVIFPGEALGNKKCSKGKRKGWLGAALLHPRKPNMWGLSGQAERCGGEIKRRGGCFPAE